MARKNKVESGQLRANKDGGLILIENVHERRADCMRLRPWWTDDDAEGDGDDVVFSASVGNLVRRYPLVCALEVTS